MDSRYLQPNSVVQQLCNVKNFARENYIPVLLDPSANILANYVKVNQPSRILEIGTAIGYSGTIMLLNSPNSALTTVEIDDKSYERAKVNFAEYKVLDRVEQHLCDAYEYIISHQQEKFDLIFLDGPKGQYVRYLPYLLDMLSDNGCMIADNVLFKGMVRGEDKVPHKHRTIVMNLRKFISEIESNKLLVSELVDIGDGIMFITKA